MEIVDFYYNPKSETIQVSFRLDDDSEDLIREDEFEMDLIENHGYYVLENYDYDSKELPLVYEEDSDELFLEDEIIDEKEYEIDDSQLLEFLTEYYDLNPKKLPKPSIF